MQANKRIISFVMVCMLVLSAVPFWAHAEEIDITRPCQIKLTYNYLNQPLENARFDVYRIGNVDEDGYKLTGDFAEYPVNSSHLNIGASDVSEILYSYALMDGQTPDVTMTINDEGVCQMELPQGLYLIAGQPFEDSRGMFTTEPMIIALPYRFSHTEPFYYDININPKSGFIPYTDMDEINRSVMKIWHDQDEKLRPQSIEVYLLRDREVVDTVTLSAENRWVHRWENLSEEYEWRVVEKPVPGYIVEVDLILGIYLLTNTYHEQEPTEPTVPTEPTTPTEPSAPTVPSVPTEPSAPTVPTIPTEPSVPTVPTIPTEPSAPTVPTTPTEPSAPTAPTTPTEPSVPTVPTAPTVPTFPTEPIVPTEPTAPTEPTVPVVPTSPTEPSTPGEPTLPTDPTESNDPEGTTVPTETEKTEKPTDPATKPTEPEKPKLPQTGQLWWPVPLMFVTGFVFVVIGLRVKRGAWDED